MDPVVVSREHAVELSRLRRLFRENADGQEQLKIWERDFIRQSSFVPGDPQATAWNEGKRYFVLQLLDALDLAEQPMAVEEPVKEEAVYG